MNTTFFPKHFKQLTNSTYVCLPTVELPSNRVCPASPYEQCPTDSHERDDAGDNYPKMSVCEEFFLLSSQGDMFANSSCSCSPSG